MNQTANSPDHPNRRQFLKTSSAATLSGIVAANLNLRTFGAASDTLKVGLIGCGGRGTGAANQALNADEKLELTAMADAFPDQLNNSLSSLREKHAARIKVTPETSFVGLDAYEKVLGSGVDVVILATPPGFRPVHFKAAVEAGKHIFCEKPMATDAPGIRSVMESVAEAKRKKLAVVAGFCWRYDYARREMGLITPVR
jgi:myo-inositol 2-dehydrogenase / D-chiro-inositol 1-dehydrogenase